MSTTPDTARTDPERADLLDAFGIQRYLFLTTVEGLTDEQAATRTTASELTLGGLVKHVALTVEGWCEFIEHGATKGDDSDAGAAGRARDDEFRMLPGETLESVVALFHAASARTDAIITAYPDLATSHELPPAPWFEPGQRRSARRSLSHLLAELAQHSGHADILREAIDGRKTMG